MLKISDLGADSDSVLDSCERLALAYNVLAMKLLEKRDSRCFTPDGARPDRPRRHSEDSSETPVSHEAIRRPKSPRPPEIVVFEREK